MNIREGYDPDRHKGLVDHYHHLRTSVPGLTIRALARQSGLSEGTVWNVLRFAPGQRMHRTLEAFEDALQVFEDAAHERPSPAAGSGSRVEYEANDLVYVRKLTEYLRQRKRSVDWLLEQEIPAIVSIAYDGHTQGATRYFTEEAHKLGRVGLSNLDPDQRVEFSLLCFAAASMSLGARPMREWGESLNLINLGHSLLPDRSKRNDYERASAAFMHLIIANAQRILIGLQEYRGYANAWKRWSTEREGLVAPIDSLLEAFDTDYAVIPMWATAEAFKVDGLLSDSRLQYMFDKSIAMVPKVPIHLRSQVQKVLGEGYARAWLARGQSKKERASEALDAARDYDDGTPLAALDFQIELTEADILLGSTKRRWRREGEQKIQALEPPPGEIHRAEGQQLVMVRHGLASA